VTSGAVVPHDDPSVAWLGLFADIDGRYVGRIEAKQRGDFRGGVFVVVRLHMGESVIWPREGNGGRVPLSPRP